MSLAELPIQEYATITSSFLPQMSPVMCYSASLTNILNHLKEKEGLSFRKFTLSRMNQICNFKEDLGCYEPDIPIAMNEFLKPYDYEWKCERGPKMTIARLRPIVNNHTNSLCLVNVNLSDYCEAIGIKSIGRKIGNHVLVVMGINHDIIYLWDPMENYFKGSRNGWQLTKYLPIPTFLNVWDRAEDSRWVGWAQRVPTRQAKLPLNEDGQSRGVE